MPAEKVSNLNIHLQPNTKINQILCFKENVLQVKVTSVPQKGEANKALIHLLSKRLSISKSSLTIIRGHTTRNKVIEIHGLSQQELIEKLTKVIETKEH